jgi:hypothetical protein
MQNMSALSRRIKLKEIKRQTHRSFFFSKVKKNIKKNWNPNFLRTARKSAELTENDMYMHSVKNSFHLSGGVNTVPLSVLFQYKMIKRKQEIRGTEDYSKANFASWYVVPRKTWGLPSAPKLPCPFGAAAGIPRFSSWFGKRMGQVGGFYFLFLKKYIFCVLLITLGFFFYSLTTFHIFRLQYDWKLKDNATVIRHQYVSHYNMF